MYSAEQVRRVTRMVALGQQGLAPAEAARIVLAEAQGRSGPGVTAPAPLPRQPLEGSSRASEEHGAGGERPTPTRPDDELRGLMTLVKTMEAAGLRQRLEANLEAADSPWAAYLGVVRPLMWRIGAAWGSGSLSVAAEHLAGRTVAAELEQWRLRGQPSPASPLLLLACVSGEQHDLALQGVALHAQAVGWRTEPLGARTPPAALSAALSRLRPAAVGLSVTVPMLHHDPHTLFVSYAAACGDLPWIVGGAEAARHAALVRAAGATVATEDETLERFLRAASA